MIVFCMVFAIVVLIVVIEWMREIHTFKVTHYHFRSDKLSGWKEKKIILLSDLHNYNYGIKNDKLLQAVREQNPDLILIAGDMLVGKEKEPTNIASEFVEALTSICDVYYANGNHEYRMKIYTDTFGDVYKTYRDQLVNAGVHYLENSTEEMEVDGHKLAIHGLEIPREAYKKFGKNYLEENFLESSLGKVKQGCYNILIAHNPIYMKEYLKWGADLIVSGHLHGGVARIPGFRGVITPQFNFFPKYSGELTQEGKAHVVVSKGIGIHTIKVRFLNPAEIVVMHISGMEE